ncbi:MAG: hypothetical protein INR65_15980 [Gluconacetobacter diazotrophicus]|nr:hypothetical protein [Gluconacetobacter diazotrophicus]
MSFRFVSRLMPCLVLLGGCSLSGAVTHSSLDYAQVLETVTDDMLATNILLARDQAPLHFTDLSQIRGSLQLQAQASVSEPFGSLYGSDEPPRAMLNGMVGAASNPTFDVVPLNTKSFTEGINAPIDPKYYQYLVNREQDDGHSITIPKLFFAKVRLVWTDAAGLHGCSYFNSPTRTSPSIEDPECAAEARIVFGTDAGSGGPFDLVATALQSDAYYVRRPPEVIGRDIRLSGPDLLRGSSALASGALHLQQGRQGRGDDVHYTLFRERTGGVYCSRIPSRADGSPGRSAWITIRIANLTDPVDAAAGHDPVGVCGREGSSPEPSASPTVYLYIRSVEGIFQYLGRMLVVAPSDRALPFSIDEKRPRHPRFSIDYRGSTYYVAESFDPCRSPATRDACRNGTDEARRRDETLFILSILNQLLDLYKNGSDIPVTPAVQAVP